MRRNLAVLLALVAVAVCWPAGAEATPVVVLGRDGHASVRNDPYLSASALTPAPATGPIGRRRHHRPRAITARAARAGRHRRRPPPQVTFYSALRGLYHRGRIDQSAYSAAAGSFTAALAAEHHLSGTRLAELRSVTETMHTIAVSHQLTPSRLPAIEATLAANREWWTTGPLLAPDQRVEFAGSQLVWEYYPGQGIQLQILATFGKADGLYTAGPAAYPQLEQLLSEIIPLASQRGGGLAWEYWFNWDGGSPPWTSAMSQATGLEALTRAYEATNNPYYLSVATQALPIFSRPPPAGVAVKTQLGVRFIQYTFAPETAIINAFLQTLIGLYDFAHVSGNQTAAALFAAGNAEAQAEVPSYNTGAWSLYQPGIEDDLSYHELVTGFLQELCQRTSAPVYCTTAQAFTTDLTTPPVVTQRTFRAVAGTAFDLRFELSKYSHVGIVVSLGSRTVFATSASFAYGPDSFSIPGLRAAGTYSVRLAATDLAGNFARTTGALVVRPRPHRRRKRP
ncbi:MAG: D-glucuronyl C5-epimerase family protein [Solirubrobacteraceae bacterium]